jgi:hypothetical protein
MSRSAKQSLGKHGRHVQSNAYCWSDAGVITVELLHQVALTSRNLCAFRSVLALSVVDEWLQWCC